MRPATEQENSIRQLQVEVAEADRSIGGNSTRHSDHDGLDWAWLLWAKRRLLARWTIRGLVVTTIIAFVIPKQYESTARLMPPDSQGSSGLAMMAAMAGGSGAGGASSGGGASSLLGGGGSSVGGLASQLLGTHDPGALWSDMLKSRSVQDHIIDKFDLRKVYGVKYYDAACKKLTKYTDVSVDRKSGVITIVVTDRDKQRAQRIAQAYIDELDRVVALVSTSSARRERIFLDQRIQQVKHNLDEESNKFAQYASNNTVIDVDSQTKAMVEGAAALQGQLIAAQSELDGLEQIYTGNNVRVRSLKARVDELRSELQKMGGAYPVAGATESAPASDSDQLYPSIRKLPLLGVRWLDLYHETKIQETVYALLTQQYEIAKIEEAKEIPSVKVLDSPNWPERKSFPPRLILIFMGLFLSLGGAVVWVLGVESWESMDPLNPRKQLAQEVLSTFLARCSQWKETFLHTKVGTWWTERRERNKNRSEDL